MTPQLAKDDDSEEPQPGDLWVVMEEKESNRDTLSILQVTATDLEDRYLRGKVVYTTRDRQTPFITEEYAPRHLTYKLPDEDEWSNDFRDVLNQVLDHLMPEETAQLLDGEPTHQTNGERGFAAASFWVLEGISKSIEEWSVHQGHGPSRYGKSVKNRIEDLPEWIQQRVLESEHLRWEGGIEMSDETAARLVELKILERDLLDADIEEEARELVEEFGLEYDEFIEGHFTAHDCPNCGAALIERPKREDDDIILLDCSDCDSQFEGVMDENALTVEVERELDEEEA